VSVATKVLEKTNQKVNGDVLIQDCDIFSFNTANNFPDNTNWNVYSDFSQKFPELPGLPSHVDKVTDLCNSSGSNVVVTNNSPVYHVAQLFEQIFIPPAVAANKCNVELPRDSDSPDPKIAIPTLTLFPQLRWMN